MVCAFIFIGTWKEIISIYYPISKVSFKFFERDKISIAIVLTGAYVKMLHYDRIGISEGIDVNKTNKSTKSIFAYIEARNMS